MSALSKDRAAPARAQVTFAVLIALRVPAWLALDIVWRMYR